MWASGGSLESVSASISDVKIFKFMKNYTPRFPGIAGGNRAKKVNNPETFRKSLRKGNSCVENRLFPEENERFPGIAEVNFGHVYSLR
jgi:hypothetical protein